MPPGPEGHLVLQKRPLAMQVILGQSHGRATFREEMGWDPLVASYCTPLPAGSKVQVVEFPAPDINGCGIPSAEIPRCL